MEGHVLLVLTNTDVSTLNDFGDSTITIEDVSQEESHERSLNDKTRVVTIITQPSEGSGDTKLVSLEEVHCVYADATPASKSVGVQVEAKEDEERRSAGLPPNRRLTLPMRYGAYVLGGKNDDSDSDYCPQEENRPTKVKAKRVGRPRKQASENPLDDSSAIVVRKGKAQPFACQICQKRFSQKGNMKTHMRIHTAERPFTCKTCGKSFKGKGALHRHSALHTGEKPFPCSECDARLSSARALKEHQAIHSGEMLYQCSVCLRGFRFISIYRRHMAVHSGEKPFRCSVCGRCFMHRDYLRSHMRKHTGERPYKCAVCSKQFAHLSDVARHNTTHTGAKPYDCKHCGATFSDRSSRRRHEQEHTQPKLFACEICRESFKRPVQLKQHLSRCNGLQKANDRSVGCRLGGGGEEAIAVQGILEMVSSNEQTETVDEIPRTDTSVEEVQDESSHPSVQQIPEKLASDEVFEKATDGNSSIPSEIPNQSFVTSSVIQESSDIDNSNCMAAEVHEGSTPDSAVESHTICGTTEPDAALLESLLSSTAVVNYVNNPDFTCQEYYNWLSNFTTIVKLMPVPLQSEVFSKISQVHKTLADVLASPSGVLATKENFQIVLSISKDLHSVITAHLCHVFNTLDS